MGAHEKTSLLLVDDHAIVRQGLAALLAREADFAVCGEAGTYEDGLAAVAALSRRLSSAAAMVPNSSG